VHFFNRCLDSLHMCACHLWLLTACLSCPESPHFLCLAWALPKDGRGWSNTCKAGRIELLWTQRGKERRRHIIRNLKKKKNSPVLYFAKASTYYNGCLNAAAAAKYRQRYKQANKRVIVKSAFVTVLTFSSSMPRKEPSTSSSHEVLFVAYTCM